ncbi:MAG: hypothetical protein SVK08_10455, partial [Halobacteriota archaeon]|nr:hypothetical protein [Halobacteriota archaeon]
MWEKILSIIFIILIVSPAIYGGPSSSPTDAVSISREAPDSIFLEDNIPIRLVLSTTSEINNSTVTDFLPEGLIVTDPGVAEIKDWGDFTELKWNIDLSGEMVLEY